MNRYDMPRREHGYSVLELLVSLSIGLLVALAAVQLFVTNQVNFQLQRGLSDVSENGRFSLDYIARNVRRGDYVPTDDSLETWPSVATAAGDLPSGPNTLLSADNQSALPAPATGRQGGIGPSDRLTYQYYTPVATTDCEGAAVPAGRFVVLRLYLRPDTVAGTGSALVCEGGYHEGGAGAALQNFVTTDTGGVVLMSAVDNFQVLLGLANTGANNAPQNYVTIAQYAAMATPRPPVSTIRFGMLVSSVDRAGNLIGASPGFTVLDQTITSSSIPTDNRVRRLYSNSVVIRNQLIGA